MRIEGNTNIESGKTSENKYPVQLTLAKPASSQKINSAANLELAAKVALCPQVDTNAVERARQLILSGQLDTPEAAAKTASAIVADGI